MSTTGKVLLKGKNYSLTEASPDDPIYSRGLIVGGVHSINSLKNMMGWDSEVGSGKASTAVTGMGLTGTERTRSPEPRASSRDSEDGPAIRELKAQVRRDYPDIDEDLLDSMIF